MAGFQDFAVVLGAGASRGAHVVGSAPPLDTGFFKDARRLLKRKNLPHNHPGRACWNRFVEAAKKAGLPQDLVLGMRLEEVSTYLEARIRMRSLQLGVGRPRLFRDALHELNRLICFCLLQSNGTSVCPVHRAIFEVAAPSTVVSFNYDLIADQTLISLGWLNWSRVSYAGGSTARTGTRTWVQVPKMNPRPSVPLLKLHGSMHWERHSSDGSHYLSGLASLPSASAKQFDYRRVPETPAIVPPIAAKTDVEQESLRDIWANATRALKDAPGWFLWGYSFPATDTISQVMFRTALRNNKKSKPIVVINPDFRVSETIARLLSKVRIIGQWPSAEAFLAANGYWNLDVI